MLKIVLCDDNHRFLNNMSNVIDKIISNRNINGKVVFKGTNTMDVEKYLKNNSANVFLLDIDLKKGINGFELALRIRKEDKFAYIVFVTGHLEYVFQSFKTQPFNFIPKPITKEVLEINLLEIYNDYLTRNHKTQEKCLEIKSGGVLYRLKKKDIIFIEKISSKTIVHMLYSVIQCYDTLERFENVLKEDGFLRCHKSFICNKRFISQIRFSDNEILFETGQKCSIGRKYKKGLC